MTKKVLLLSASAGAGHMRAADALYKVFKQQPEIEQVEHWDILTYTNKVFRHLYGKMYIDLVNKSPKLLGWFYDISDTPYRHDKIRTVFEKLNARRLIQAIKKYNPDLVICTHFTPAAILAWLFEHQKLTIVPSIVVTDYDCHAMWLVRSYAKYFVAIPETAAYLKKMGIRETAIQVTGIPIDPVFEQNIDSRAARQALGLNPDKFTVLVSAGGFGVGPVERVIGELSNIKQPIQVVAIAGRSAELQHKLKEHLSTLPQSPVDFQIVGFTTQIDEYMAAADILLGKSGGLTSSEAMARGLPMCIVNPIPGQEERNSDHLLEAGAAVRCNNLSTLAWKIEQLIADPQRLLKMRQCAKHLGKPHAAQQIVQSLMVTS